MTRPLTSHPAGPLRGNASVPGDKSISHRSLIFAGMAKGRSEITGLLEGDDVLHTAEAVRQLGATVEKVGDVYVVEGADWSSPSAPIYCGNAGTAVRLLMGAVAGQGAGASFDGDRSLRSRPMGRILDPLALMGVNSSSDEGRLPVTLEAGEVSAVTYRLPKPSAQIKSAVMLAALGANGTTTIEEPELSRDHTERLLPLFGVPVEIAPMAGGGRTISISGPAELTAANVIVPRDPSSAAFPIAAAAIVSGSVVDVPRVLMNDQRTGLFTTLLEMGADLVQSNAVAVGGEDIADLRIRHAPLRGVTVPAARAPSMIDEYPILAVIAATATGTTRMEGIGEMRVKESDRIAATEALLRANGIVCRSGPDWLEVDGTESVPGGGLVVTHDDHRIAMSGLVLGMAADAPVTIDDADMIDTSFNGFAALMTGLGARIASP